MKLADVLDIILFKSKYFIILKKLGGLIQITNYKESSQEVNMVN